MKCRTMCLVGLWTVLLLTAAASVLHRRQPADAVAPRVRRGASAYLRAAAGRS